MVQPWTGFDLTCLTGNIYIYIYSVFIYIICLYRWPKIDWNAPWLLCSSGLCTGPCTVHFVYNTTYKVDASSETTTLYLSQNVHRWHTTPSLCLKITQTGSVHFKIVWKILKPHMDGRKQTPTELLFWTYSLLAIFCQHNLATPTYNLWTILMFGLLESSATLASSSVAIFQWNNTLKL